MSKPKTHIARSRLAYSVCGRRLNEVQAVVPEAATCAACRRNARFYFVEGADDA